MRLDLEPTVNTLPLTGNGLFEEAPVRDRAEFQKVLEKGVAAAKRGERDAARTMLSQAVEIDPLSEEAWMWLASISDYPEELAAFLNNVLTINPANERAEKWLAETRSLLAKAVEDRPVAVEGLVPDISLDETVDLRHAEQPGKARPKSAACPFCKSGNETGSSECGTCRAVLSLSDIDALLSNTNANRGLIEEAVIQTEAEMDLRELDERELTILGIGHLNLRNFDEGVRYLHKALNRDPNNVVLFGQLNTIAIRRDEMRRRDEHHNAMPKGKTILIVDDSPIVRKLLASKLEKSGHNVVCAVDGIDGLEKIAEALPDMVLLDVVMPGMGGYEVCKHIRLDPVAKDLPVVMISGNSGFFDKILGRMAGANDYITKPFGPETLMKTLETYLVSHEPALEQ